ncbi:MAG: PAS domain S-box protein, partial [Candidatus Omnitrophica bacterium]|nr:PAS domain S-box protein [Candidatus Omnitrophota bacterium]
MSDDTNLNHKAEERLGDEIKFLQIRITELEKTESRHKVSDELLRKTELQQKAILNNIPDIAWLKDRESRFIVVNEAFARSCGLRPEELVGKADLDIWPRELAERYRADDKEVMESGKRKCVEEPLADKENKVLWIETIKTPIYSDKGEIIGTTGIARDITERKKYEEKLREARAELEIRVKVRTADLSRTNEELRREIEEHRRVEKDLKKGEERYKMLIEYLPLLVAVIDESGKFIVWSKYSEKLLGYTKEEVIGKISQVEVHESKEDAENVLRSAVKEGIYDDEIKLRHKDGKIVLVHLVVVPFKDKDGFPIFYGFAEDISKRKQAENELLKSNKRLKQLVLMDEQTRLYNHRYLGEVIEAEYQRAKRYAHPLAVIMLDIDYFKSINDVYGHQFGDLVIKQFARQLKKMVRRYDVVIRFGGEEFIIISPGLDRVQVLVLAQRLLEMLNLYNFGDKKHVIKLKLSIAVVSYPQDRAIRGIGLINSVDQILNKAKESGGNRVYSSLELGNTKQLLQENKHKQVDVHLLKGKIEKLTKRANQGLVEAIFAFAKTIELKDHYTGEHVENTVRYTTGICEKLGLPKEEVELIKQAAVLHDLGKIGISEKILLKRAKLTKKEFTEIKKHPQIGADILRPI